MKQILLDNKRFLIGIFCSFIFLFLFILGAFLFSEGEKNLVLRCFTETTSDEIPSTQVVKLYDYSDSRRLVVSISLIIYDSAQKENVMSSADLIEVQMNNVINSKFGINSSDVIFSINENKNGVEIVTEYIITEENSSQMYEILEEDLWGISVKDLKEKFVGGGAICD